MDPKLTTEAAPQTAPDTTIAPAPAAPETPALSFDDWTEEELAEAAATGRIPDRLRTPEAPSDPAAADQAAAEAEPADGDEPAPAAEKQAAEDAPADADVVTAFAFTENADADTFRAEADTYLGQLEIPAPLQQVIDHYRDSAATAEQIAAQYQAVGDLERVSQITRAFNDLVDHVQDQETGRFVPNTESLVKLLTTEYRNESERLLIDLNSAPSDKYRNYTRFQEFIRDGFGLSDTQMESLDTFLSNNGEFPAPSFVPEGIEAAVAEAFWRHPDRERIVGALGEHLTVLKDEYATEADRATARQEIQRLNGVLKQIQFGYDATRKAQTENAQRTQVQEAQRLEAVGREFMTTVNTIADSISNQVAKSLSFVEGPAAGVVAAGIVALARTAYSPDETEASLARETLKTRGIVHDWSKGRGLLDRLFDMQDKLSQQTATQGVNPQAIENTKRALAGVLREIAAEQKEVVAKLARSVSSGASAALKKKIELAPKVAAVKAKATGRQPAEGGTDWDKMPLEDLRKVLTSPGERALRGDLSGFAG